MQVKDVDRGAVASAASKVACLSDVYTAVSVSGKVVVKATQRRPVARLFYGGKEYYFDSEGVIMPSSRLAEPDVIVTGGDFTEPLRVDSLNAQVKSLVLVASWLDASKTYKGLVDQLYIERDGDIIMVPKLGSQLVELGDADNLDEKFAGLMAFYREGMPRAGWNTYSRISLKFRGQVVCTKENINNKNIQRYE